MYKLSFLVFIALLFSACSDKLVRVMPYEKEYFAQDKMSLSPISERSEQEGHIFLIREAVPVERVHFKEVADADKVYIIINIIINIFRSDFICI